MLTAFRLHYVGAGNINWPTSLSMQLKWPVARRHIVPKEAQISWPRALSMLEFSVRNCCKKLMFALKACLKDKGGEANDSFFCKQSRLRINNFFALFVKCLIWCILFKRINGLSYIYSPFCNDNISTRNYIRWEITSEEFSNVLGNEYWYRLLNFLINQLSKLCRISIQALKIFFDKIFCR